MPYSRGPVRLVLGELAEVVAEPLRPRAVEPRPERRLADHHAAGQGHPLVVVGGAGDHVDVGVDVVHGSPGVWSSGNDAFGVAFTTAGSTIQTTIKPVSVVQRGAAETRSTLGLARAIDRARGLRV